MSTAQQVIRVLHVTPGLDIGGTAKTMQLMVTHLDRARFAPAVWSPADGPRGEALREAKIPVIVGRALDESALRFAPHIVHLHRAGWPEPEPLRTLKAAFRPDPQGLCPRLPRLIETNVFGRHDPSPTGGLIDVTLFVSHFCARRLREAEGLTIEPPRHRVLYNPVDTQAFARLCPAPALRDYSRPVFGRLSRPDPGKWSPLALEPLLILRQKRPDFRYLIVGGTDEAKSFVVAHGLESNVQFLPPLLSDAELANFFNSVSFMAHANDTGESFGLVIAEAMASGLAVVTHPAEGWRDNAQLELVLDGETGLIARNAEEYAEALKRLLDDAELCRRLGAAGQARAERLFKAQTIARRLEAIYEEALGLGQVVEEEGD